MLDPSLAGLPVSTRNLAAARFVARVGPLLLAGVVVAVNIALAMAAAVSLPLIALAVVLVPFGLLTFFVAARPEPPSPVGPPTERVSEGLTTLLSDSVARVDPDLGMTLRLVELRYLDVVLADGAIHVLADPEALAVTPPGDIAALTTHRSAVAALEQRHGVERAAFEAGLAGSPHVGGSGALAAVANGVMSLSALPLRRVVIRCRGKIEAAVERLLSIDAATISARQHEARALTREFHLRFVEPLRHTTAAVPDIEVGLRSFVDATGARPGATSWPPVLPGSGSESDWRALFDRYVERIGSRAALLNSATGRRSDLRLSPADIAGWPVGQRQHAARTLSSTLGGTAFAPVLMRAAVADVAIVHLLDAGIGIPEFSWAGPVALRHDGTLIDVDAWADRVLAGDPTPPPGIDAPR